MIESIIIKFKNAKIAELHPTNGIPTQTLLQLDDEELLFIKRIFESCGEEKIVTLPGDKVECVDAYGTEGVLIEGHDYVVEKVTRKGYNLVDVKGWFPKKRFKRLPNYA